jgi:ubiquinone biosynthesis protein UbiJ
MIKVLSLGLMLLPTASWAVEESKPKTQTFTIETNEPVTPSDPHVERTPFFAEPSAANEVMEEVEALKDEIRNLKARVSDLEKNSQKK